MEKRFHLIWMIGLLLSNYIASSAHTAQLNIEKTLTEADGLAANTVLTIFQDSHGTMWFGTTDGLSRYDGERFQTFTTEDGLAQNTIGLIFEDPRGMLWFGDGVLASISEREDTMDLSWMETPLSELDLAPQNETPAATIKPTRFRGISRYDRQTFRIFTTADGLASDNVKDIVEDKAGNLWFATASGISHYDGEKFHSLKVEGPMGMKVLPDSWNEITAIAQDTAGNFWFGSTAGITYYNLQTSDFRHFGIDTHFAPFQEMGQTGTARITALLFDTKENLWMSQQGTDTENSGVRRFDGKKLTTFPQSQALPMNSVNNIMQDSTGNLWFTGVKKLPPQLDETEESIRMIAPEIETGVSLYNGKTFQNFNKDAGLPSNRVWSVFEDSSGKLWFATDAGAAVGVYLPSQNSDN